MKNNNLNGIKILQALKRILVDEDNGIDEIPGLDQIEGKSEEEKALIEELKKVQANIHKKYKFKNVLKVKPQRVKALNEKFEEKDKSNVKSERVD